MCGLHCPDLNDIDFCAGAMLEHEEDGLEVNFSSPLTLKHQRWGSSGLHCSVYEFVQHLLWPATCPMQDSYNSR